MKRFVFIFSLILSCCLVGCQEESPPSTTNDLTTVPATSVSESTVPPQTEPTTVPEQTGQERDYIPQDPDPLSYPEGDMQGTLAYFAEILYVHDNRPNALEESLPEGFAFVGLSVEETGTKLPRFAIGAWHIPNYTEFFASPDEPNYIYYRTESGYRRMIRAALVENYWGGEPQEPTLPENYLELFFQSIIAPSARSVSVYNQAMGMAYETAEKINLYYLFYNGFLEERGQALTEAEAAFLMAYKDKVPTLDNVVRLPVCRMDEYLHRFFGISFEESDKAGTERMVYWENADCYYVWRSDSRGSDATVKTVESDSETGEFRIIYELEFHEEDQVMTLRREGEVFRILSNTPVSQVP